jgi:predicted outer membrane protein
MNPETPQLPIDYLNQIAPAPQKPGLNKKALLTIVALIGVVLTIVVSFLVFIGNASSGPKADMQTLAIRMQALHKITDSSQKNIKSGQLRGINSNLRSFLSNANRDIVEPLTANKIDVKKFDKKLVAKEEADPLKADLEDARLNATFDDTYAREMSFKLTTLSILMESIHNTSKSKSMKEFLVETDKKLQQIKTQLEEFNPTNR